VGQLYEETEMVLQRRRGGEMLTMRRRESVWR